MVNYRPSPGTQSNLTPKEGTANDVTQIYLVINYKIESFDKLS